MKTGYTEQDMAKLQKDAERLWEIDLTKKAIRRRPDADKTRLPLQAIYRMVKHSWRANRNKEAAFPFPFLSNPLPGLLALDEHWDIELKDRKYIDNDMILIAGDGRTILISNEKTRIWETPWFQFSSYAFGLLGLFIGILSLFTS